MRDQSSPIGSVNRFRTTRWSMVLLSAQSHAPGYKEALGELCSLYWYPLYGFVLAAAATWPKIARDLTQGFFLHLIERRTLTRVDPRRANFG